MEGWNNKKIEQIGVIHSGSTPSTNNPRYWDGDIVWITPYDLSKLSIPYLYDSCRRITSEGLKSCSASLLPAGSIVLSSRAPIGYVAVPQVDFCTNQGCKSIKLKEEYDSRFVYYNINFNINKLKHLGEGTTFSEISKADLAKITMLFPRDKNEQAQIAEILSTIDKVIEQTEAIIEKQTRIKTGLMQDLLTKGIDENGNLRFEETYEFKDSPIGRIPVEWDTKELGKCAYVTKLAGFEYTNYFDYGVGGDIIALRALNIKNERLDLSDIQRIPTAVSNKLQRSKIFAEDILITYIGAYIGDVLRIEENDRYHLAPNIAKIVAGNSLNPRFLEVFLRSNLVQQQIRNLTAVTATPSLTMTQIRKLLVAIPRDIDEQDEIALRIHSASDALNSLEAESNKLHSLKTALMQDLLTGKVSVTKLLNRRGELTEAL